MPRQINIANASGRDAKVQSSTVKSVPASKLGHPDLDLAFQRYLATTTDGLHESLAKEHGADYAQALIDGDPETDLDQVGRAIGTTHTVFLSGSSEVLHAAPEVVEIVLGPHGEEKERRTPEDQQANINDAMPVRWRKRRLSRKDVVTRFVIKRTLQIRHDSGITYDYLYAMAKELHDADQMALMGAGEKGRAPLRFNQNGAPYQEAFLEGRIDGDKYMLLLHLSDMQLKLPPPPPAPAAPQEA